MTKATDTLMRASLAYAEAKRAVDEFQGERRGAPFETVCAAWRQSVTDLLRAARVSGAEQGRVASLVEEQAEGEPA